VTPPGPGPGLTPGERIDRRRARSWALQVVYRWESGKEEHPIREALAETLRTRRMSPRRLPLVRAHVERLDAHLGDVDAALSEAMENWRLDRLSRVDRSVLRLSGSELLFQDDVPPKVALQEGIRLAGQYGGTESARFVNGVLDAVLRRSGRAG
jgi:transcription antitermination protein NusB